MVTKGSRILIVDDSQAIQAILREYLRGLGYEGVEVASSAKDGLERVEQEKFDVVFLDMVMPGESGADFAQEALSKNPRMKVVVTTALPYSHESVMSAISQGASDYLPKPIRVDGLKQIMQRLEREQQTVGQARDVTYV